MAASVFVQPSAARKCDCGAKVQPYTSGIAGEYTRGKWRRIGGFCASCVQRDRAGIRKDIPLDTDIQARYGYGNAECSALIAILRAGLFPPSVAS